MSTLRAKIIVLTSSDGAHVSRVVPALRAAGSFEVTVATSLAHASRLLASLRPEALVIDDDGDVAALEQSGAPQVPVVSSRTLADTSLVEKLDLVIRAERARRLAVEAVGSAQQALSVGGMAQWRFDAEARSFAWAATGGTFAVLTGEGGLRQTLIDLVHPSDRARVEHAVTQASTSRIEYRLLLPRDREVTVVQQAALVDDASTKRRVLRGTIQDVTALRAAERDLDRMAYYDSLTSLPNRAHVTKYLAAALDSAARRQREVAILSIGIEGLSTVNATFGRAFGDSVVREVAKRLRDVLEEEGRELRLADRFAARHGAEELLVVLCDGGETQAADFFRMAMDRLAAPMVLEGARLVVSCSAGTTIVSPTTTTAVETVLAHADAAMHIARAEGRGAYRLWSSDMQQKLERRVEVERKLRDALASRTGIELHYQPKVDAHRGTVKSVEALLRWAPDGGGPMSPLEIISVAEESGLIHALGKHILHAACTQGKAWCREAGRRLRVAVNVSAQQFASADFADTVAGVLAETQLPPELLELEVTEGVMMVDGAPLMLTRLKELGVRIALDDFGTGYSSLSYLTRFPIDCLKVDRSFVLEIGRSPKGEAILRAIVALSHSLDLEVVAEGVETPAQHAFLAALGDVEIQGWLYSKALPGPALVDWLVRRDVVDASPARATG